MSSNLLWEPTDRPNKDLSTALKFALRKLYGEPINVILNERDLLAMKALEIGKIEDASQLIEAIQKHGEITIWEQY